MLQSAISYCRSAGLKLSLENTQEDLTVVITGVRGATGADGITRFSLTNPVTSVVREPEPEAEAA